MFGGCEAETCDQGSPPAIPKPPLPQQVPERFDGLHLTFGSACGAQPGHPTAKMNEIRQRTHVASRPGSIFWVFGPENRRKSIRTRNGTNFCARALLGHSSTWK